MSDKSHLQSSLKTIQRVRTWQLVVLLIIAGFISATFLRMNNIGMVERRAAVISADEAGDPDVMLQRMYDLQVYTSQHMNTDLGDGIFLENTYSRDVEKWEKDRHNTSGPNGNIFVKAQEVCAPRFSSWSPAYVRCVADELAKYPAADSLASDTSRPRQEMYIYTFSSPLWSPDFAGWSVLVCLVITGVIIARLLIIGVLHLMLRQKYRHI